MRRRDDYRSTQDRSERVLAGSFLAFALVPMLTAFAGGCAAQTVGGCQTSERSYGLPAIADSLAEQALDELRAPGRHPRTGPALEALHANTAVFAQIGAVDGPVDSVWVAVADRLTGELQAHGVRIARRSLLQHTTGPCFPPYHVDFAAVADSGAAARFLEAFPKCDWPGFEATEERKERTLFISAGTSLELMNTVVDLRPAQK